MTTAALNNIIRELTTHPREREGFQQSDITNLSPDEALIVKDNLLQAVSDGDLRCNQPLKWLLADSYTQEITDAYLQCNSEDHGSIYLPYVLFESSKESSWIEKMMQGIAEGEPGWGMRRSALMQLKEITPNNDFVNFCWRLADKDQSPAMQKSAARHIAANNGLDVDSDLRDKIAIHIKAINLADKGTSIRQQALKRLKLTTTHDD